MKFVYCLTLCNCSSIGFTDFVIFQVIQMSLNILGTLITMRDSATIKVRFSDAKLRSSYILLFILVFKYNTN